MFRYITSNIHRQSVTCITTLRSQHLSSQPKSPDDSPKNSTLERIRAEIAADKAKLQWRKPIGKRPGDWNSKFGAFADDEQTSDYIVMMQQPIDLSPSSIKEWLRKRKERVERFMQQYIPERHETLGSDLAAAHFLLYRGGAVKFHHEPDWRRANKEGKFDIPNKYNSAYKVEGLRCDEMVLYYEGLENLRNLHELKFLSFHNVHTFDDWSLDRVSGSQYPKLEVLDISGTCTTVNGLSCLYRIPTLKLLIVDNPKITLEYELACSMLEETIPKLKIIDSVSIHNT